MVMTLTRRRLCVSSPSALVLAAHLWMAPLGAILFSSPAAAGAEDDIRALIGSTWDKPDAKVETDPVVVEGGHAIADWTQGDRGGRALLREEHGSWRVMLCSGDPLRHASGLVEAGVPEAIALKLAQKLAAAEASTDPKRLALFATFEGVMRMDDEHGPAHESQP